MDGVGDDGGTVDLTRDDADAIAGGIDPNPYHARPMLRIIPRGVKAQRFTVHFGGEPAPNVRPCDHARFTLDTEWNTVTCGACGERVDPFAVLLLYAEHWDAHRREQINALHAESRLHVAALRSLAELRCFTADERAEMRRLAAMSWNPDATRELRDAARKWERERDTRRESKRAARRSSV